MDQTLITVLLIGFAGISTGLGAIPVLLKKNFSKKTLDLGMGFSAGIMLVASFISLIIPGIENSIEIYGKSLALFPVLCGIIMGYLGVIVIHRFLPHEHIHKDEPEVKPKNLSRVTLIVLAIALHNIPEGLSVGVGFGAENFSHGVALAIAIAVQNMPEGLVVAFGMVSEGSSRGKAFLMALLSGLVEPVAATIGYFATRLSNLVLPISLGFAGGAMLFVICQEMFPELFREGHEKMATAGVVIGVISMLSIDFYLG